MRNIDLFLRRAFRTPLLIIASVVILAVVTFSFGYTSIHQNLPCVVYVEEPTETTAELVTYLEHYHFIEVDSRDAVIRRMQKGEADCGLVVSSGLQAKMESGHMENAAEFLISPRTSLEKSYSLIIAGALLKLYSPYFTVKAIEEYGYETTFEEVDAYFARSRSEMTELMFEIVNVDGVTVEQAPSINLSIGLIALVGFLAYGFFAVGLVRKKTFMIRTRFHRKDLLLTVILPRLLPIGLMFLLSSIAGILLGLTLLSFSPWPVLLGTILYYVLLSVLFALLLLLPVSDHFLICAIALNAVLSLVLLPIYRDFASYIPILKYLRGISIPNWLFLLCRH